MTRPRGGVPGIDLRGLLDPLKVVRDARPRVRQVPEQVIPPPDPQVVGAEAADLEPIVVPARVDIEPDPEQLPDEFLVDGQPDLRKLVALALSALAQYSDQEIRSVTGRAVLTSGQITAAQPRTVQVEWDSRPDTVPTDVTALALPAMPTALGRLAARVLPATVTATGCSVQLVVTGAAPVVVTTSLPVAVEVVGRYVYAPPYTEENPAS